MSEEAAVRQAALLTERQCEQRIASLQDDVQRLEATEASTNV